jgi:hypothetical protein
MKIENKSHFLKTLISLQIICSAWFIFGPDFLPDSMLQAERYEYKAYYFYLDFAATYLFYAQIILCILLWIPKAWKAYLFAIITFAIVIIGSFSGAVSISAADSVIGSIQIMITGAILANLWMEGYFFKNVHHPSVC